MQHVNDDMDELFRRAAEDYPLNTDSADWNAVAKKLSADKSIGVKESVKANRNYKHLLWLLLLLPIGWLTYNYISNSSNNPDTISKNIGNKELQDASLSKKIIPQPVTVKPIDIPGNSTGSYIRDKQVKSKRKLKSSVTHSSNISVIPDEATTQSGNLFEVPGKKESDVVPGLKNYEDDVESKNETVKDKLMGDKKEEAVKELLKDNNKGEAKKTKNNIRQKERGLYAGIVVSPDISTVKFQSVKNMGIGMGLLVGYQFNTRLSAETGVSWDIKNYYSDGKHFNAKRVYPNPNSKIISVNGVCNMIEVPVNLRYKLTKGKVYISTTAGVSSYIMKKEKYDYLITYNNGQPYPHSSTYYDSSTNFLAVANLSVGYNRTLKRNLTLRVEPYIKIPLKGVGVGSLPIMSTGLNIGITKKISR